MKTTLARAPGRRRLGEELGKRDVAEPEHLGQQLLLARIVGEHLHPERSTDPDHVQPDPPGADDPARLSLEIEPLEPCEVDVASPPLTLRGQKAPRERKISAKVRCSLRLVLESEPDLLVGEV